VANGPTQYEPIPDTIEGLRRRQIDHFKHGRRVEVPSLTLAPGAAAALGGPIGVARACPLELSARDSFDPAAAAPAAPILRTELVADRLQHLPAPNALADLKWWMLSTTAAVCIWNYR